MLSLLLQTGHAATWGCPDTAQALLQVPKWAEHQFEDHRNQLLPLKDFLHKCTKANSS